MNCGSSCRRVCICVQAKTSADGQAFTSPAVATGMCDVDTRTPHSHSQGFVYFVVLCVFMSLFFLHPTFSVHIPSYHFTISMICFLYSLLLVSAESRQHIIDFVCSSFHTILVMAASVIFRSLFFYDFDSTHQSVKYHLNNV